MSSYPRKRFTSIIYDYFICSLCSNVVVHPTECTNCESLYCTECAASLVAQNSPCTRCSVLLTTQATSRFALKTYSSMYLCCHNKESGCEYEGNTECMLMHEKECLFENFKCTSPLCENSCLLKDKFQGDLLVCSDICSKVVLFDAVLDTNDEHQILSRFHCFLREIKETLRQEIMEKIDKEKQKYSEMLKEKEKFEQEEQALQEELDLRKSFYHNGKWAPANELWSCCRSTNKLSIGCRPVSS